VSLEGVTLLVPQRTFYASSPCNPPQARPKLQMSLCWGSSALMPLRILRCSLQRCSAVDFTDLCTPFYFCDPRSPFDLSGDSAPVPRIEYSLSPPVQSTHALDLVLLPMRPSRATGRPGYWPSAPFSKICPFMICILTSRACPFPMDVLESLLIPVKYS